MLQVYTGNGKGKTTAAIGLAVRMLGTGQKVYIMQFMKGLAYSEQKILKSFAPQLVLKTTGKPFFIATDEMMTEEERAAWGDSVVVFKKGEPPPDYVKLIEDGLREAINDYRNGDYGLIILDELNVALLFGLVGRELVEEAINAAGDAEIVLTGRGAPDWLLAKADLVSEMKEVKHYYNAGVEARRGIEN